MRILSFTGGAGAMYCGSCLRDNALAAELLRRGHDVLLTPVYTPTRTDERNVSERHVFFGGISVYLEQHAPLFRYTPRILDRLWDSEWALRLATRRQIPVNPRSLGELTVSMLRGERGFQRKEIAKLLDWLRREPPVDVVNLPYALLIGLAEPLRRALQVPLCCTLQGEDLFLDGLGEPYRSQSLNLIREAAGHVDAFLPVSQYYADYMPKYLRIPLSKIRVAPLGINLEGYTPQTAERSNDRLTIGFFARIAPEKGLHVLCDAYRRMRAKSGAIKVRLVAAGYLAPEHQEYLGGISRQMEQAGLAAEFEYRGELDRAGKIAFLQSLDVMSVPATYDEPKGMFLLEAMAVGVPVVQPRRGAFPEIVEKTGGGLLVDPGDPDALATTLQQLLADPARRRMLGAAGAAGVRAHYTVGQMAERVEEIYRGLVRRQPVGAV